MTSVVTRPGAREPVDSELRLEVPGDPRNVRVVRLVALDAAARAGFDCDRADDLRIAVDELCHAVMACTDLPLTVRFTIAADHVQVDGMAARARPEPRFALGSLSARIVGAVAESFDVVEEASAIRFTLRLTAAREGAR